MDAHQRERILSAQGADLAVVGDEVLHAPAAQTQDVRELVFQIRAAHRRHRRLFPERQGIPAQLLQLRGPELVFPRGRGETAPGFVVVVSALGRVVAQLFQIVKSHALQFREALRHLRELLIEKLFLAAGAVVQTHPLTQLQENVLVRAALPRLHHFLLAQDGVLGKLRHGEHAVHLRPERRGQHDVRNGRRGGHEDVRAHEEIQIQQALPHSRAVRQGEQGVVRERQHGPDLVWVLRADGVQHLVGIGVRLEHPVGVAVEQFGTRLPGLPLGGDNVFALHKAARHIVAAQQRRQHVDGPAGLRGVEPVLKGTAPLQAHGRVFRHHPRRRGNLLFRNPGNLRDRVQVVLQAALPELLEPEGPIVHKLVVVEILLDNHLENAQRQGAVRAGPEPQPEIRVGGQLRLQGVNDDELRPVLRTALRMPLQLPVRAADRGIGAPDHDARRLFLPVVIHTAVSAGGGEARVLPRPDADQRPGGGDVGRAQRTGKPPEVGHEMPPGSRDGRDALRPVCVPELRQLPGDLIQCLIPADPLKLPAAALPHTAQGVQQTIRVVHLLDDRHAFLTGVPLIERRVRIRPDFRHLSVLHGKDVDTAAVTASAGGAKLIFSQLLHAYLSPLPVSGLPGSVRQAGTVS